MAKEKNSLEILNKKIDLIGDAIVTMAKDVRRLDDAQRKTGVLLEHVEGKFSLVYEGYIAHDERLRGLGGNMEALEERMGSLENRMGNLESRMGSLESRMGEGFIQMDVKFDFILEKLNKKLDRIGAN